jgi:hypothetical protein
MRLNTCVRLPAVVWRSLVLQRVPAVARRIRCRPGAACFAYPYQIFLFAAMAIE